MVRKVRKFMANWRFLCRFAWDVNRRIYAATAIQIVLDVVEPFGVLIFPKFIIDELTGQKRWDVVLGYISLLIGMLVLLRLVRLGAQVFCNMAINGGNVLNVRHYTRFFLDMDYARLEDEHVRDFQETITGKVHVNNVAEALQNVATALLCLAGYAYLVFMLHPLVLLAVALVTSVNYLLGLKREKCNYAFEPEQAGFARKFDYFFETMADFGFAKEVRINQASAWLAEKFFQVLVPYQEYMRWLGVVFQDLRLFAFSMEENITMGMPAGGHTIEQCIDKCGLLEKCRSLPQGLRTNLSKEFDEGGVEFSGGEGQKLALARVLYKNAPIIILDKPTAALDPLAEYELYSRFQEIVEGKCAVYISHRLSSTRFTGKIAVFHQGDRWQNTAPTGS